jgi:hypothetical protein
MSTELKNYEEFKPRLSDKRHLGVITDHTGSVLAIPPGANILIIEPSKEPGQQPEVIPLVLLEIGPHGKRLVFQCGCRKPDCTRRLTYALSQSGVHPYLEKK